jgi:RNA-directed DNA polymerase
MNESDQHDRSASVPKSRKRPRTQPAEDVRSRWLWTEDSVWTNRMLTALEKGVKGGKWFRLIDKVFSQRCLESAAQQVLSNKGASGVDHVSVNDFASRLMLEVGKLSQSLQDGTYRVQAIRRKNIPKPGSKETRPLGIPTVRDRVVQTALVKVIEPIFERDFAERSYGFRPGRSCHDALRRVDQLIQAGYVHVVDADLKGYFDSIPHDRLMTRLQEKVADGRVLSLIEMFLQANIVDGMSRWTPTSGAPQGAVLSPLLSNVYLDPLDHLMAESGFEMARYADDFVILCRTADDAARALEMVQRWTTENGLTLHPTKTKLVDVRIDGFDFLGYHFRGSKHWVSEKSIRSFKETIRRKTPSKSGRSLFNIIADVNRTLRGWFVYFKHSRPWVMIRLDIFIRQRLRTIVRKRSKRRGCARSGMDNRRWPNAYFAKHGLFNLVSARAAASQSSLG